VNATLAVPQHSYPVSLIDRLQLPDGRSVIVRPVLPQDAAGQQALVAAMSPDSRRMRFHGAVSQLPASVLRQMTAIDYQRHVALIAEALVGQDSTELVADARYVLQHDDPSRGEFAVAVADAWQGQGLGRTLLTRLAEHACRHGVQVLDGSVLVGNRAMLGLMQQLGATITPDPDDDSVLRTRILCAAQACCAGDDGLGEFRVA
jgi:RimJ/RimL family protein N-acetyltransferase